MESPERSISYQSPLSFLSLCFYYPGSKILLLSMLSLPSAATKPKLLHFSPSFFYPRLRVSFFLLFLFFILHHQSDKEMKRNLRAAARATVHTLLHLRGCPETHTYPGRCPEARKVPQTCFQLSLLSKAALPLEK